MIVDIIRPQFYAFSPLAGEIISTGRWPTLVTAVLVKALFLDKWPAHFAGLIRWFALYLDSSLYRDYWSPPLLGADSPQEAPSGKTAMLTLENKHQQFALAAMAKMASVPVQISPTLLARFPDTSLTN